MVRENLENARQSREFTRLIASLDWGDGQQVAPIP